MEQKQDEYAFFLKALKDFDSREGRGFKTRLAIDADISAPYLTQILKQQRRAGFETQVAIANALEWDYYKFLEYGRSLILTENSTKSDREHVYSGTDLNWQGEARHAEPKDKPKKPKVLEIEHKCLVEMFIDKPTAKEINKKLLDLEKHDPELYRDAKRYIDYLHAQVDIKKIAGENSE